VSAAITYQTYTLISQYF